MLTVVTPAKALLDGAVYLPQMLEPLVSAVRTGRGVVESVVSIVGGLGFDNFMYGASASPKLDHESRSYVFTTLPREWVQR